VTEKDLEDIWQMSTDISTGYGTAIHKALEAYHKYHEIGAFVKEKKDMEFNYVLPKNKFIRDIVRDFVDQFGADALSEVMVSDVANLRAGQIDRLQIVDPVKKVCRVGDYKTNNDLDSKKLKKYQHQLSFYAHILNNKGWTVEGLDIFHHNGEVWERIPLDVLDLVQ
jgi:hypothetical protein